MTQRTDDAFSRETALRAKIMRRVWSVYLFRRLSTFYVPQLVLLAVGAGILARSVSIKNVFMNMPSVFNVPDLARFFSFAFSHTAFAVQLATVITAIALAWLFARLVSQARFLRLAAA